MPRMWGLKASATPPRSQPPNTCSDRPQFPVTSSLDSPASP